MSDWVFWGKLDRSSGSTRQHPLTDHCVDVALVFRRLVDQPAFRSRLVRMDGSLSDEQLDRLAVIALLHDIGKCNWGFQRKAVEDAGVVTGHVNEAVALLYDEGCRALWPSDFHDLLLEMARWFLDGETGLTGMLLAAISHHGRPVRAEDIQGDRKPVRWWLRQDVIEPVTGLSNLVRAARSTFPAAFEDAAPIEATSAVQQRFAGLVMLADWIGSDTHHFPFRDDPLQDRAAFAEARARRALSVIGLSPPRSRRPQGLDALLAGRRPTPLQAYVDHGLPVGREARIALIESETGSGKTEAAIAWFLRLYEIGNVDSLYFALPTRVAARELYERVRRAIDTAFPDPESRPSPVLLAAPGYVRVDGERLLPDSEGRLWEDDPAERQRERQWVAAHPKRFLAAPVAVGTIDQALLSVLRVKHSLLRSVCLDRSLLVVDEVHASDPYMRQLLQLLVESHSQRGGWCLLLSATLGNSAASALLGTTPLPADSAERVPYPAIRTTSEIHSVAGTGRSKCVDIHWIEGFDDSAALPLALAAIAGGARVLVICNTVSRANSFLRCAESSGRLANGAIFSVAGVPCPHHGRFSRADREVMDAAVTKRLGVASADGALLLVGTQTLEQSLDIDADVLISDLCPMDVMLQRIGRLHRHPHRRRPTGFTSARVWIRTASGFDLRTYLRPSGELRSPAGIGTVYPDGRVLQRTMDELRSQGSIEIPRDNRALVERTTHPEALQSMGAAWLRHGEHVEGQALAMRRAAETSATEIKPFGELSYGNLEERITTRLGIDVWRLRLTEPADGAFDVPLTEVDLPARLAPTGASPPETVAPELAADGFRFHIGPRRYRYTRFGLEVDDDA